MPSLSIPSPVGQLTIDEQDDAIVAIRWADAPSGNGSPLLAEAARQLAAYFDGRLSPFRSAARACRLAVRARGCGRRCRRSPMARRVPTAISPTAIGSAPRAVGRACGRNPIPIVIPCHRVLAKGGLGGYSGEGGLATKQRLLALEGALGLKTLSAGRPLPLSLGHRALTEDGNGTGDPFCENRRTRGAGMAAGRGRQARAGPGAAASTARSGSTTSTPTSAAGFTRCRCRAGSAPRPPASSRRSGPGSADLKPGDRVAYAGGPLGAYSEARVMPADRLVPVPAGITDQQAAAMMLKGMTAWYLIRRTHAVKTRRDDPDPRRGRRGRAHRLPMGQASRRHRDRHGRRRREGRARQGTRLRPPDQLPQGGFRRPRRRDHRRARNCRSSTIRSARTPSSNRSIAWRRWG